MSFNLEFCCRRSDSTVQIIKMESELDVIDALEALAYTGKCLQNDVLTSALEGGPRSEQFREVIAWLAKELHILKNTDENVSSDVEPNEFAMELSAMLKELGCPYVQLVTGPLSERFENLESRMQVIEFLITELMATKMVLRQKPVEQTYIIPKVETNTARALEQLSLDLNLEKPPENVTPKAFFDKLNFKAEERLRQVKQSAVSEPMLSMANPYTDAQWKKIDAIHLDLDAEYNLRREMLLTRLEVTIQSFKWSDRMKSRENDIANRYALKLQELEPLKQGGTDTNIVALLAARSDLAIIEKTSSVNVRKNTASRIQKHIIGSVPDRGGRAHEHAPPPPEMPSWQQQRASGPPRGGFGGDRGGQRGGRGGHWQQNSHPQQQRQQQFNQQPYEQRAQCDQQGRDRNWVSGSGRVQGTGWSQKGNGYDQGDSERRGGGGGGSNYQRGQPRGRSNYNRGGGSGYRR